jgi:hypothetical protein
MGRHVHSGFLLDERGASLVVLKSANTNYLNLLRRGACVRFVEPAFGQNLQLVPPAKIYVETLSTKFSRQQGPPGTSS